MKKKYSFLLTVLIDEETSQGQLHGRIQKVGRNEFQNFTCTEELKLLIYQIVDAQRSPEQLVSSTLSGTSYFSPADSVTPAEAAAKSNS
jgi:hypothetical protein